MRMAVFTAQFPGRVNSFFVRDMRALIDQGFEIDVYSIHPLDPTLWALVPDLLSAEILDRSRVHHARPANALRLIDPHAATSPTFARDSARIVRSAAHFGSTPVIKSLYTLPQAWAWAQTPAATSYDHVLAYWGNYAATAAYVFHRLLKRPIPFTTFLHAGTDLYRDQVFLREKLLYADHIIVVCEFNRRFIEQLYPDDFAALAPKIALHHLGLELDQLVYQPTKPTPPKVIAVGRYARVKGFDDFLRAVGETLRTGIPIEVELIGEGTERPVYERIIADYQMGDRVTLTGWLPQEEVYRRIAAATVLVHPSSDLGDAVPTVIKEAMALGTPVIGTNIVGIPELLDQGRCGILVPAKDYLAIHTALIQFLTNDATRQHYARAARQFAEQTFDMHKNGARLARILTGSAE